MTKIDVQAEDTHEIRALRWRNKQLEKQLDKVGKRIYRLRCALAEARDINDKIARGHVRRLEAEAEESMQTIVDLRIQNEKNFEVNKRLNDNVRELRDRLGAEIDVVNRLRTEAARSRGPVTDARA